MLIFLTTSVISLYSVAILHDYNIKYYNLNFRPQKYYFIFGYAKLNKEIFLYLCIKNHKI